MRDGTEVHSLGGKGTWSEEVQLDPARFCGLYLLGQLDLDFLITARLRIDQILAALRALDDDPAILRQVIEFG